mmetsp:Transcript_9207/g.12598  ORF Transcript_9207/g.12598 Transcript_9207/m.12598 type:complete len:141 (-) Transcript_9207:196-618(-)
MLAIKPGEHGSTYGGNPLACAVAMEALAVLRDEDLAANALRQGERFRSAIRSWGLPLVQQVRGLGLLNAVVISQQASEGSKAQWNSVNELTWSLCVRMAELGLLAKPTHGNIIRFAPPLTISDTEMDQALEIIRKALLLQ